MVDVEFLCTDGSLICTDGAFLVLDIGSSLDLITDRTQLDVDRVKELASKGWAGMTASERNEWLTNLKGAYNYSDLNRVGEAIAYIADRLNYYGYDIEVSPKTDWKMEDIPRSAQMTAYLSFVKTIRGAFAAGSDTPSVPSSMKDLTWQGANDIEKILLDVDTLISNMETSWYYSGDLYAGEV